MLMEEIEHFGWKLRTTLPRSREASPVSAGVLTYLIDISGPTSTSTVHIDTMPASFATCPPQIHQLNMPKVLPFIFCRHQIGLKSLIDRFKSRAMSIVAACPSVKDQVIQICTAHLRRRLLQREEMDEQIARINTRSVEKDSPVLYMLLSLFNT
jgi:hypothetical protein